ncbi:MAG: glycogen/starch/alpha-glucan phosphorylase [Erysipelotrichaceae bacterium]|nr:glycogen/starch/alpha-glucan phosphorylase [Erysipelotrichaceae bacterium]
MFTNKEEFIKQYEERFIQTYGRSYKYADDSEKFLTLGELVRDYASENWMNTKEAISQNGQKQLFYFSMEFLIGRLLTNNLMNMGIYEIVRDGLADMGIDLNDMEEMETDAGLGNGGLGRLAACFLDSLATLGLPGHGNTIRYEYGLFKQKIENNKQVEVPDIWLKYGNPWEVRKTKHAVDVKFYGEMITKWESDGKLSVKHVNAETIRAVPYDVPIVGHGNKVVNTLRLWKPEASEDGPVNRDFIRYLNDVAKISQNVYPDDSTEKGRELRVKQEYFFVSAGAQTLIRSHLDNYHTLDNLHEKVVIQLNDTHPIMIVAELMRIMLDEYKYDWDKAWYIVSHTVAYTNHTIMQEALEKWPESMIMKLLPRIHSLIREIDRRFKNDVLAKTGDYNLAERVAIIKDGLVHMAHMGVASSFSVNGVAAIHTEILKKDVMKDFYQIFPEKFNNKTNGVTHRRWLAYSNPQLRDMIIDLIGDDFIEKPFELCKLAEFADDKNVQARFAQVKLERKKILAKYVKETLNIDVNPNSIFDVQAKRLHAYKRQMLNCMHLIYMYQYIKEHPDFNMVPHTYLFGAKAAPAYVYAKKVIELINAIADKINNDPVVNKYMKVVFIPNYCVSIAEILLNAADVSEQISTAGKEASGTSNMKLMMNGAITLGTLDGANVEIKEHVGEENIVIFGNTVEDLRKLRFDGYNAMMIYQSDPTIKKIMDSLIDGTWDVNKDEFRAIYDELLYGNDEYFHFADFYPYLQAHQKIDQMYKDQEKWNKMCLLNIASSGYFSTDRTIEEYNRDIWHLDKVKM